MIVGADGAAREGEFRQVQVVALKGAEVGKGAKLGAWYADGAGGGEALVPVW